MIGSVAFCVPLVLVDNDKVRVRVWQNPDYSRTDEANPCPGNPGFWEERGGEAVGLDGAEELNPRDTCQTANKCDLVDLTLQDVGILKHLLDRSCGRGRDWVL